MNTAANYARRLLSDLDAAPRRAPVADEAHPALLWARSGAMALTGRAEGSPLMCPVPLASCAEGALAALRALVPTNALDGIDAAALLGARAAIAGHVRRGTTSPGGACELLPTCDGHIALNLTRDGDRALLPAWLQADVADDAALRATIARHTMHDLIERGRELGLAVAPLVPSSSRAQPWFRITHRGAPARHERAPRVLDLSSLWAGPLCGDLLRRCGADVVKLESLQRPDGARRGPPAFFDLLNGGKRSVAFDLSSERGRAQLRALIAQTDIVIEASRPRALRQMGIHAETLIDENPGLTWISLSGYGRGEPQENWIAYGDDAGVAAGLSWLLRQASGELAFVGDAIADPLAGLHAALAAWAVHQQGGGRLISLSLVDVLRYCIAFDRPADEPALRERQIELTRIAAGEVAAPRARAVTGHAAKLGADTAAVIADWGAAC